MSIADYIKSQLPLWPNWINIVFLKLNVLGQYAYGLSYVNFKRNIRIIEPEKRLIDLVNHAISNVPYYRNKYKGLVINSIEDFNSKISFTDKDEVMAHWDEFIADGTDLSSVNISTTGGTSGKAMKIVQPRSRYIWELAFMHSIWRTCGWNYDTRAVIRNHHLHGRGYIVNPLSKEIIFDAFESSDDYYRYIFKTIRRYRISYVHAYPSSAYLFCQKALSLDFDLCNIKAFICGSEGITEVQDAFFKKHNIQICTWYGHSEKLILAGMDKEKGVFIPQDCYGYTEIIDHDHTGYGELVGTTFFNSIFPLIRYKTDDWAYYHKDSKGKLQIERIIGRRNKSIIYKIDGTYTSLTALNLHGVFYEHVDGMQYIQEKKGFLKVLIIKNKLYTDADERFLLEHLSNAMGGIKYVRIEYVENLTYQKNGKFLPLISSI